MKLPNNNSGEYKVPLIGVGLFMLVLLSGCNAERLILGNRIIDSTSLKQAVVNTETNVEITEPVIIKRTKVEEVELRSIYVTADTVASQPQWERIHKTLLDGKFNGVVIDYKDFSGHVYFDTNVGLAKDLGLVRNKLKNIEEIITQLHSEGIYVIARHTVFQDPALAVAKPEWAIRDSAGGLWKDYKGLTWVDPSLESVWDYNIALAKDAVRLGYDEINFDYIRFPSDGPISRMRFANYDGSYPKHEMIRKFFAKLYDGLKDEPIYISADLFGLTTVLTNDMNIGQLLEDAGPYFDYIMPMMYPSHYGAGYLGFKNPADHPYEIIVDGVKVANERLSKVTDNRAKIRPWIQDFDIGAVYGYEKVQAQIKAIKDANGFGWTAWNARNVYNVNNYK